MKKKIKRDFSIDEDKRCIVDMTIMDSNTFLSPYCGNTPLLGSEAVAYLENAVKNIPAKKSITIQIKSNVLDKKDQNVYRIAIRNYYHNIMQQISRDLLRNTIVSLIMAAIGIAVITVMLILSAHGINKIWDVVLEIIGWVFLWEAVDKFCFERHILKQERQRADQLKNANILFLDER